MEGTWKYMKVHGSDMEVTWKYMEVHGSTYRTKLKLDKEVGGGDLTELRTITYLIAYPYA